VLEDLKVSYELVLVNDGSEDDSYDKVVAIRDLINLDSLDRQLQGMREAGRVLR